MSAHEPLTVSDAIALGQILDIASRGARVRWTTDGGETIREGVARHIVAGPEPHEWNFLSANADVRDGYLRITTSTGLDVAIPVLEVVELMRATAFVGD